MPEMTKQKVLNGGTLWVDRCLNPRESPIIKIITLDFNERTSSRLFLQKNEKFQKLCQGFWSRCFRHLSNTTLFLQKCSPDKRLICSLLRILRPDRKNSAGQGRI